MQMTLHALFGSLELMNGYTAGVVVTVLFLRLAIMASLAIFAWMTFDKRFRSIMDPLVLGNYMVREHYL